MGTINAMDNYDRLSKEYLNPKSKRTLGNERLAGEQVQLAAIDGQMRLSDGLNVSGRWQRATLMLTERHVIVFQGGSTFHSDYGIAIPYSVLADISYKLLDKTHRRHAILGIRFEPKTLNDPLLEFATEIDDIFSYDATIKTLMTASNIGGVHITDNTHPATMNALGLHPLETEAYTENNARQQSAYRPQSYQQNYQQNPSQMPYPQHNHHRRISNTESWYQ